MRNTRRWAVVWIGLSLLGLAGCATAALDLRRTTESNTFTTLD